MSYGHDEYLYGVFNSSKVNLADSEKCAASYIIRFHSFYPWHNSKAGKQGYRYFADD